MKDQAFSPSSDLAAPHPLSRLQVDSLSQSACVSLVELIDKGGGRNLIIRRRYTGPFRVKHSILSGSTRWLSQYMEISARLLPI
jgi:hypothetical protein